ncbi:hypothetical protein MXB_5359, partial [Myxobolus squamalis]
MNIYFHFISFIISALSMYDDITERDTCLKIRHHQIDKRDMPTLVGAGSSNLNDDDTQFELLHYNFESQHSFLQINVQDSSPFENNGRFSPGGLVLQIPGSSCNNAAYLACSDIVLNGDTFQAKPTYGITVAAFIMMLDVKGRHNIFETYGYSNPRGQFHLEVDYGILRWFHGNAEQHTVFEVAAELVPLKIWTHVAATFNSTTGIAQVFINGKPVNRTVGVGKMSKDWSCLAHLGGGCHNKALMGFIDEIRIYNYALSVKEVEICSFSNVQSFQPSSSQTASVAPSEFQEEYFIKKDSIPLQES